MVQSLRKNCIFSIILLSLFIQLHCANSTIISDKIANIEKVIQQDPGNRGVKNFFTTALFDATQCLEKAKHVAILTGFFIPSAEQPETDGPLGSMFLAQSLVACGKKVTIVTDSFCKHALTACYDVIQNKIKPDVLTISIFPDNKEEQKTFVSSLCSSVDCLVSLERVGRSADGTYRTMRGLDITQKTAPLDDLFLYAQAHPEMHITTIGIGDGGNEIGMGNKQKEVKKYIAKGELICCVIPADYLIVTGVSNWGGYALAGALWCTLEKQSKKSRSFNDVYPTNDEQYHMLQRMVEAKCCDGVLGKAVPSVDGLSWDVHKKILDDIREVIK